jgi:hypothetical protein
MSTATLTRETRKASYENVKKTLRTRQQQVFAELGKYVSGCTASELAMDMWDKGFFNLPDRNSVHPRLNELVDLNYVETIGKRTCKITKKTVAVYRVKGDVI